MGVCVCVYLGTWIFVFVGGCVDLKNESVKINCDDLINMHCHILQHTPAHSNTLQHAASLCNTLQHSPAHSNTIKNTQAH